MIKKLIFLTIIAFILSNCEIRTKEVKAENELPLWGGRIYKKNFNIDNIEYHVFNTSTSDGGIFVVNHTKELLEVEKLKLEIEYYNKQAIK